MKLHQSSARALAALALFVVADPAIGQTRDQRLIREAGESWQRYIAEKNVDAIVALHTPDAVVMFSNAPLVKGTAAVRSTWQEVVNTPGLLLHWIPTKIEVTSPTTATEYGTYTESFNSPGGKMRDAGNYVVIWKKVNGQWRIALDAPSTTTPLPAVIPAEQSDMVARAGNSLTWSDFAPPGFPTGGKISVLHGDPFSAGRFVLRLSLPDGYQVPIHWHPSAEYITVISGSASLGMGNSVAESMSRTFNAGDFVFVPPRQPHFAQARGPVVIEISGNGPFQLNLGTPPRSN
jgi:ketosteroid isomerase-like protein/quercetin dioxygenase-like cupin family protein